MAVYTVADYLVDRLAALGASHLFHVPGNYTAQFLGRAQASGKIQCVGAVNELEAGYAADAYARLRPIGVACVTYGVGSFSLYNAVAGAFVERCPLVLINGSAQAAKATALVEQGVLFAHAIDPLRTDELIFRPITAATAVIVDGDDAPAQIDRVLVACITEKKPVYLEVRDGVWLLPCQRSPAAPLVPAAFSPELARRLDSAARAAALRVQQRIAESEHPILWGGEELQRYRLEDQFEALVAATGLMYTTTLLGKSLLAESLPESPRQRRPEFIGVYDSKFAPHDVARVVENSDCVVALGTILSDFYGDIVAKSFDTMILAAGGAVRVGREVYPGVALERFLDQLVQLFTADGLGPKAPPPGVELLSPAFTPAASWAAAPALAEPVLPAANVHVAETHAWGESPDAMTWRQAFSTIQDAVDSSVFLLTDTSLALFPSAEILISRRNHFIAQTAWLSIGYAVGAAVGVSTLLPPDERVMVLAGDGGFQMVAQAFATLVKLRKSATIVVFDNGLYAIEQFLIDSGYFRPGADQPPEFYCRLDLDPGLEPTPAARHWNYVALAEAFGGVGVQANDPAALAEALAQAKARANVPTLIAARIVARDLPPELAEVLAPPASAGLAPAGVAPATPGRVAWAGFN